MAQHVYSFAEADPERRDILGGKGASLAAMTRAGLPVPPGFTLSAECCSGAWPEDEVRNALARLEQATGRTFGRGPKPLLLAVRSGAAHSMPGMMDTILNCGLTLALVDEMPQLAGDYADHIRMFAHSVADLDLPDGADARSLLESYATLAGEPFPQEPWDALAACIQAVYASWHSARAVAYRRHHDITGLVGTAVNVQAMFPSERAGVLFTANPNDVEAGEMVLEASWGLGEAVVSGAVTPDVTILDAETLAAKSATPGQRPAGEDAPALTPEQVREVAELGQQVEAYFGVPCDIEWGLADGEFVLLQSRPIRGLEVLRDVEVGRRGEIERLRTLAGGERVVWVEHNLAETLPHPTPLTWDIVRHFMSGSGGFGRMYRDFGYRPSAEVDERGFLELICGRVFADPRRAAGLFWRGVPFEYGVDAVAADPSVLDSAPRSLNMAKADPAFCLRLPGLVWGMLRGARVQRRARAEALEAFEQRAVPRLQAFLDEARGTDLQAMGTRALIDELHRRRAIVLDEFGKESLKPGFFGGMAQEALLAVLVQLFGDEEGGDLMRRLTSGLDHDTTVEQSILLDRVARGEAEMVEFLDRFGHRCAGEMELAQPRWREDPSALENLVKSARRSDVESSEARHARQTAARREAEARLPQLLAERGGAALLERIEPDLRDAQRLLPYRETGKHWLMLGYETLRAVLVELGRRWELGRDVFFLQLDELGAFEEQKGLLTPTLAQRKVRWRSADRLAVSAVVDSDRLEELGQPRPVDGDALCGKALASGAARGTARVVRNPSETGDLGTGYILVCPSTDPGWTPLFVHARGLVVERGGMLSHGAIVARDFGIPAVACEGATSAIPDGAVIEIDGTRGTVSLVQGRA